MVSDASAFPDPAAWGLPDCSFEALASGSRNAVFRGTGPASCYVFKSTRRTEAQHEWLQALKPFADAAGLHISLPMRSMAGGIVHQGWTVERFVTGRQASERELSTLARQMRRFHAETQGFPQRPGFSGARALTRVNQCGDIDLTVMPKTIVQRCRLAWEALPDSKTGVVHADLNLTNMILTPDGRIVLLDWDEARVDLPAFDHVAMGLPVSETIRRAALAYEVAACWCIEPERARRLASDLP